MCIFVAHVQYVLTQFYRRLILTKMKCAEKLQNVQHIAHPVHVQPKMCNVQLCCATKKYDSLAPQLSWLGTDIGFIILYNDRNISELRKYAIDFFLSFSDTPYDS